MNIKSKVRRYLSTNPPLAEVQRLVMTLRRVVKHYERQGTVAPYNTRYTLAICENLLKYQR